MAAMFYQQFPFMGRCVEAGDDHWGNLLCILYGNRKGKVSNERIMSGLVGTLYGCTKYCYQGVLWLCHSAWWLNRGPREDGDEDGLGKVKDKEEQVGCGFAYISSLPGHGFTFFSHIWSMRHRMEEWGMGL